MFSQILRYLSSNNGSARNHRYPIDAFISYATDDRSRVMPFVEGLKDRGLTTWMAPDDVPSGATWAEEIIRAIGNAKCVIVFISSTSIHSDDVFREVQEAVRRRRLLFPVRIEDVELSDQLRYYIGEGQWIDFFEGNTEKKLDELAANIQSGRPLDANLTPAQKAEAIMSEPVFEIPEIPVEPKDFTLSLKPIVELESGVVSKKSRWRPFSSERSYATTAAHWYKNDTWLATAGNYGQVKVFIANRWDVHDDVKILGSEPLIQTPGGYVDRIEHGNGCIIIERNQYVSGHDDITGYKIHDFKRVYPTCWALRPGPLGTANEIAIQHEHGKIELRRINGVLFNSNRRPDPTKNISEFPVQNTFSCHRVSIEDIAWHPGGRYFATTAKDHTVRFWDAMESQKVGELTYPDAGQRFLSWSPDGTRLLIKSPTHTAVHTAGSWTIEHRLPPSTEVHWNQWGNRLFVIHQNDATVYDGRYWRPICNIPKASGSTRVSWHSHFLVALIQMPTQPRRKSTASLWNTTTGEKVAEFDEYDDVMGVSFACDEQWLATCHANGRTRIWEFEVSSG